MKVYLDNCCFNRPFDDQTLLSTRLETEAKLKIQEKIKAAEIALGWSYILDFENNANPFLERQIEIQRWKKLADSFTNETPEILAQMKQLMTCGLKPIDALHVACAIELKCDYFLTVDKGILKKAAKILSISVTSPINLIIDWGI
jgi:predicted nucleic acid-binding protein